MAANHNIEGNQGETLNLHILYTDTNDSGVDLSSYIAEMQVRRSSLSDDKILHMFSGTDPGGVTAGITGSASGVTGGIFLNRNAGNSGSQTGGILIIAGSTATSHVPSGRHLYDLEIKYTPTGETTRLLEGRYDNNSETTR
tara:strand:+ start:3913 stop:4335 length:423 start_codon:yes stop_codon:yes gene_type:complete